MCKFEEESIATSACVSYILLTTLRASMDLSCSFSAALIYAPTKAENQIFAKCIKIAQR